MAIPPDRNSGAWLGWLMALLLLPCLAVQLERGRAALASTSTAVTSGCEEESFYAIWRTNHGLSAYVDSSEPPYAAAYFNWLFYRAYHTACADHPDAEIPYRGRVVTLAGAVVALILCGWACALGAPLARPAAALAAVALLSSGLFGWWLFTVRPDVWALALEIGATGWFLAFYPRRRWLAVGGAAVLAYAAWSFKQANVAALGAVIAVLFVRRDRLAAVVAAVLFALAVGVTLGLGDPVYRSSLTSVANGFDGRAGWTNLGGALVRALPVIVLPVYAVGLWRRDGRPPWAQTAPLSVQLAAIGLALSGALAFAGGFKDGAAHNYYFTAAFFATLLGVQSRQSLQDRTFRKWGDALALVGCAAAAGLAGLQLTGRMGTLSLHQANAELTQRLAVWSTLPGPRFSADRQLALPWLNPGQPVYLPGYTYGDDRARGRPFVHDGIGGLIRGGAFASLFLPASNGDSYDGSRLSPRYVPGATAAGMTAYHRAPDRP